MYFGECEDGGRDRFEDEILTNVYQRMLQALACGGGSLVFMEGQVCKRWRAGKATWFWIFLWSWRARWRHLNQVGR